MSVKFYQAGQNGAPILNGVNGSLITVFDAVLVNGYGDVEIESIVRTGGTVTVKTINPHHLSNNDTARVSGVDQIEYNGDWLVSVVSGTVFVFSIATTPDSPATGSMLAKRAPAGFSKVFSASNKAVYRSNDLTGLRHFLQVIDMGVTTGVGREAQIRGYVNMFSVDEGEEPFPTLAQRPLGLFAYKSNVITSAARPWKLISDGKTFYFGACMDQAPDSLRESGGYIWWTAFGDLIPKYANDKYSSFICGNNNPNQQVTTSSQNGLIIANQRSFSGTSESLYMPRDWDNNIGAVSAAGIGHGWDQNNTAGAGVLFPYPHPQDNGFYMTPWKVPQRGVLRGEYPGVFEPLQGRCLPNYATIDGVDGYPGRTFMALWGQYMSWTGMLMFDMTGPWS